MNSAVTLPSQDNFLPLSPCSQAHCEHLETQITELSAHIHAATYRLLELIREYDDSHGWAGPGLNSCAHWLNWRCGINLGAAREKVRVAHALRELPGIMVAVSRAVPVAGLLMLTTSRTGRMAVKPA